MVKRTFKGAVIAVQAQIEIKRRFANKVEDPLNPYSNHSETESSSEDEDEPIEGEDAIPTTVVLPDGTTSIRKPSTVHKPPSVLRRYKGMLLALLSSLIFSLGALLVKKLHGYHPFSIALWRFQGAFLPVLPLIGYKIIFQNQKQKIKQGVWPLDNLKHWRLFSLVLLRSALSCNSLLLHFYSLKYMSMGDALTIASSTPILVAILSRIFLKEKCGVVTIVASVFTLVGVVAMTRPPMLTGAESFDTNTLIGSGLALGCMVLASISYTVLRYIRKVHYTVTTLMLGVWGTVEMLLLAITFQVLKIPTNLSEGALVFGLASFTFLGQAAIILAMKAEQAGPVALIRTCDVLFGFGLQIIILNMMPDWLSIVGSSIVVLAVLLCGFRKWLRGLPIGHPTRARYRYLMM